MTNRLRTSVSGLAFIEAHEGVVLTAYRDVVGVWTIGAGLTRNSGVVTPKAGMKLTPTQASDLLGKALARNYEPRVNGAMPTALQHEFDAGVSFDFNTGAINRASWVGAWKRGDRSDARRRLNMWNKAGGKVWAGLTRRRKEEANLLLDGNYAGHRKAGVPVAPPEPGGVPRFIFPTGDREIPSLDTPAKVKQALIKLGYVDADATTFWATDAMGFQEAHDLTVDGIFGPATLSTLKRQLDARRKLTQAAAAAGAGGAVEAAPANAEVPIPDGSGLILVGVAALITLWLLWQYRDWVAAKVQKRLPKLASKLRSF